jgi:hypothetical protein
MEVEENFLTSDTDIAERACIEGAKALKDRPAISPFRVLGPNTGDKPFKVKVGQCRHSYLQEQSRRAALLGMHVEFEVVFLLGPLGPILAPAPHF